MKIFILLNSVIFFLYGLGFIFLPETLIMYVTDTVPTTESGLIDMRATYGGMSVGFSIILVILSRNSNLNSLGVKASILMVGGMALGRIVGIFQEGNPNRIMYIFLALEIVVVLLGLLLLKHQNSKEKNGYGNME